MPTRPVIRCQVYSTVSAGGVRFYGAIDVDGVLTRSSTLRIAQHQAAADAEGMAAEYYRRWRRRAANQHRA